MDSETWNSARVPFKISYIDIHRFIHVQSTCLCKGFGDDRLTARYEPYEPRYWIWNVNRRCVQHLPTNCKQPCHKKYLVVNNQPENMKTMEKTMKNVFQRTNSKQILWLLFFQCPAQPSESQALGAAWKLSRDDSMTSAASIVPLLMKICTQTNSWKDLFYGASDDDDLYGFISYS